MYQKAVIELHFLPSVQYCTKFLLYPEIILEQFENYSKGSYRNRCHIASTNGLQRLSIPLSKGKNERQNIRQVEISYDFNWQNQHWMSIQSAYGNAPFFDFYADDLEPIFKTKSEFLFDYNFNLLNGIFKLIGIDAKMSLSPSYEKNYSLPIEDLRNTIQAKTHRNKLDLAFKAYKYGQVFEDKSGFLPNLSILDLLFCTGPESISVLENSIVNDFSASEES